MTTKTNKHYIDLYLSIHVSVTHQLPLQGVSDWHKGQKLYAEQQKKMIKNQEYWNEEQVLEARKGIK